MPQPVHLAVLRLLLEIMVISPLLQLLKPAPRFFGIHFPALLPLTTDTDYLTQWQITDGSTYNWYTKLILRVQQLQTAPEPLLLDQISGI